MSCREGALSEGAANVGRAVAQRFTDRSLRAPEALEGESVLALSGRADDKALREQIRQFVPNAQFHLSWGLALDTEFASRCLGERLAARGGAQGVAFSPDRSGRGPAAPTGP